MACNLLSLPKTAEKPKTADTMSEVSESGTTTSGWASRWDSREDLRDLISRLGLTDASELYQERFRVDRSKLEKMITDNNFALFPADVFFAQVMEDTDTIITWPNKLKIGAKSKKDPHVRIAGRPEDVQCAKDRILTILNTRCNRVTMKMDVSYTDHSHIIGKGGMSIKRVMEETKCHVHFPDSNRSNSNEKSNQVSISGDIKGVELARSRVRELTPLIFGFELPIMSQNVDLNSAYIIKIQEQYKVHVMIKTRPKLHATLVLVKGVEWEVNQVKNATLLLMEYMCEGLASQIPLQMSLEISPHHHPTVLGKNHTNLKAIMQTTNCQIMFPDAQDPNIPNLKKSRVTITGSIHNIYNARQLLLGSLPIMIIFDLPDDATDQNIKAEQLSEIQTAGDVIINIKQKANKTTKACVIKGVEKCASSIYKARNLILGIDAPPIYADIPMDYHMPNVSSSAHAKELPTSTNLNPSSLSSPLISPTWYFPSSTTPQQQGSPLFGFTQKHTFSPNTNSQLSAFNHHQGMAVGTGGYQGMKTGQVGQPITIDKDNLTPGYSASSFSNISSSNTSPGHSMLPNYSGTYSEAQNHSSCTGYAPNQPTDLSPVLSEMNNPGQYHGPTLNKPSMCLGNLTPCDYDSKRLSAVRALRSKPQPGALRVPHNSWSGYGLSFTSPGGFLMDNVRKDDNIWKPNSPRVTEPTNEIYRTAVMNTSNFLDNTPTHVWNRVSNSFNRFPKLVAQLQKRVSDMNIKFRQSGKTNWHDLPTMLTAIKLDHYIPVFNQHEIDLTVFSTLTDRDLIHIGITAFGARRKMLLAISELMKSNSSFSAAPGAERKNSSPKSPPNQNTSTW